MTAESRAGRRAALIPYGVVVSLLLSAPAAADTTKVQCIQANTQAQDLRRDGHLAQAREQLQRCVDPACPGLVRDDCTRRLDELEKAQPTVAFEVKDSRGADVFAVTVTMDGKPWAESLEGKALPADPGKHIFTFAMAGQPPVTRTLVITEGEKARRERVVLEAAPASSGAPAPIPTPASPSAAAPSGPPASTDTSHSPASSQSVVAPNGGEGMGTQRVLGLVSGGVGAVGIGLGTVFGLLSFSAWSTTKTTCGGNVSQCSDVGRGQLDRSIAESDATVSTAAFITGGVLLSVGAVLFLTASSPESRATTGLVVTPSVCRGQAGMALKGEF
jgi:hypothetical protein